MTRTSDISVQHQSVLPVIPFSVLIMTGRDAVDFLQRISTNDFTQFQNGMVQKTLFVSDKGRIIDTVWVIHRGDELLLLVSHGLTKQVIDFLQKYIIMDDVTVLDGSSQYNAQMIDREERSGYPTEYFGMKASIIVSQTTESVQPGAPDQRREFERWRITNGIPVAGKEIVQEYNPLELDLWDWISFTKGCYIGQEVIARLDTYKKIQRALCAFRSEHHVTEGEIIIDELGTDIGIVTSTLAVENGSIGLCMLRMKFAETERSYILKQSKAPIRIDRIFQRGYDGKN